MEKWRFLGRFRLTMKPTFWKSFSTLAASWLARTLRLFVIGRLRERQKGLNLLCKDLQMQFETTEAGRPGSRVLVLRPLTSNSGPQSALAVEISSFEWT